MPWRDYILTLMTPEGKPVFTALDASAAPPRGLPAPPSVFSPVQQRVPSGPKTLSPLPASPSCTRSASAPTPPSSNHPSSSDASSSHDHAARASPEQAHLPEVQDGPPARVPLPHEDQFARSEHDAPGSCAATRRLERWLAPRLALYHARRASL
ncbi:hypothetical protein T484DRAFT_2026163 [Baffinella frigidus]|nr:hypothetical protein T484DRAFT_2026163 [Cryptophyta sp. CCMP2293]